MKELLTIAVISIAVQLITAILTPITTNIQADEGSRFPDFVSSQLWKNSKFL